MLGFLQLRRERKAGLKSASYNNLIRFEEELCSSIWGYDVGIDGLTPSGFSRAPSLSTVAAVCSLSAMPFRVFPGSLDRSCRRDSAGDKGFFLRLAAKGNTAR